jgi:L-methionine (R)-S-oxide reductase
MTIEPRRVMPAMLQLDAILGRLTGAQALQEVCRFLRREFPHYRWAGIYRLDGEMLSLAGWDGPEATEHVRIPVNQGICGRAVREDRTVIVPDVRAAPEYLACFLETRAEIVVPIRSGPTMLGEIDIDGNEVNAYVASDQRFLEGVAAKLGPVLAATPSEPASSA